MPYERFPFGRRIDWPRVVVDIRADLLRAKNWTSRLPPESESAQVSRTAVARAVSYDLEAVEIIVEEINRRHAKL